MYNRGRRQRISVSFVSEKIKAVEMEASLSTFPELYDINVSLPSWDASLLSFSSFSSSAVLSALKKILALFSEK